MYHRSRCGNKARFTDVVALLLVLDGVKDELDHLLVATSPRHQTIQVVFADREQAGADLAIRGDANAAAMSAEGVRHRRNDADLADAVLEDIAAGGLAVRVADFAQRHELGHAAHDLVEGHDDLRRPDAAFFQRHEFDEADGNAFLARKAAEGSDLIVVEAAQEHAIDLD